MSVKLLTEHLLECLSLKGGCTGSSESTLVKMSHCWKSRFTAQLFFLLSPVRRPPLTLFPSASERHFSHVDHLDHLESIVEVDHYSVTVRRELFTQLDIDDKYLDDAEPRPLSRRIRSRLRCSRTKLYETLVYIFPIIEILKTYEWKTFTLGTILILYI